jgi:V8-like Glu-specific endopeptidase
MAEKEDPGMRLASIRKPQDEAEDGIMRPEPFREGRALPGNAEAPPPGPDGTRRRVVIGRSETPLIPPESRLGLETVLGIDERTRILQVKLSPWRMIAALDIVGPWGEFIGTGWLVGPRTMVTAGHCVYDRNQMGGWAQKITLTFGQDEEVQAAGPLLSTKFTALDRWVQSQDPDFDIAAIHLDKAVGDQLGWFGVAARTDADLADFLVNISGYPAERGGKQQWWARNRIRAVQPRRIFYDVDTSGGQSGAPVFIYDNENAPPVAIGIHAYGTGGTPASLPLTVNSAPRIIPEVVEQIEAWVKQDEPVV